MKPRNGKSAFSAAHLRRFFPQEGLCATAGPDCVVLVYFYLDSCGICKCVDLTERSRPLRSPRDAPKRRAHAKHHARPRLRYVLPAVEELCRSVAADAALQRHDDGNDAHDAAQQPASVLILKHCLRDEYDELTDIARLYRIKARQL